MMDTEKFRDTINMMTGQLQESRRQVTALRGQVATLRGALQDMMQWMETVPPKYRMHPDQVKVARAALAATAAHQDQEARHE